MDRKRRSLALKPRRSNIRSVGRHEPRGDARRYTIRQFMFPGFPFTPRPIPRGDDVRGGSHGGQRNFQHRNKRRAKTDKGGGSRKKRIQDKSVSEESQSTLTSLITLTSGAVSQSVRSAAAAAAAVHHHNSTGRNPRQHLR